MSEDHLEVTDVINRYSVKTIKQIKTIPEAHLNRIIAGQLRSCIYAHGPISNEFIGSAAKRISTALLAML